MLPQYSVDLGLVASAAFGVTLEPGQMGELPAGEARRQAHGAIRQAVGQIPEYQHAEVLDVLAAQEALLREAEQPDRPTEAGKRLTVSAQHLVAIEAIRPRRNSRSGRSAAGDRIISPQHFQILV
jgi:hypothetical protein